MVNDEIKIKDSDCYIFDKKQIAIAIKNSTLEDEMSCSLIEENILNNCDTCNLKNICRGIDKVMDEYVQNTSTVVKKFEF